MKAISVKGHYEYAPSAQFSMPSVTYSADLESSTANSMLPQTTKPARHIGSSFGLLFIRFGSEQLCCLTSLIASFGIVSILDRISATVIGLLVLAQSCPSSLNVVYRSGENSHELLKCQYSTKDNEELRATTDRPKEDTNNHYKDPPTNIPLLVDECAQTSTCLSYLCSQALAW